MNRNKNAYEDISIYLIKIQNLIIFLFIFKSELMIFFNSNLVKKLRIKFNTFRYNKKTELYEFNF